MILLTQTSRVFTAPVGVVFDYITNMENYGDWFPGVAAISSHNSLPHRHVGKTYEEHIRLPQGEVSLIIEVKECKPNQRFFTHGNLAPLLPAMQMGFTSTIDGETRFELTYYSRNTDLTADSDIIQSVSEDLAQRTQVGMQNLHRYFYSER